MPDLQIELISEYNDLLDVVSYQEKIETRKNNCQVCYFGVMGKNILEKIIKKSEKNQIML